VCGVTRQELAGMQLFHVEILPWMQWVP